MSPVRALAPYAAVALLIVIASAAALASSLPTHDAQPAETSGQPPGGRPRADPQAVARQLGTPRFAYWREEQDGRRRLWVSDAQGSRRWPIGDSVARDEVRQTGWSPDGAAVAHVAATKELVVTWLNGRSLRLPSWRDEGADEARRILGLAWSADSGRIATTQRRGSGRTAPTDVFVANLASPGGWIPATAAGDVRVSGWAGADELLVETGGGLVGLLRIGERDAIRPLTGMAAASPRLGPDGRIYFGGEGVTDELGFRETRFAVGSIWSTTLEGDLREESALAPERATQNPQQFRLEGRWPDGRFVLSVPGGVKLSGSGTGNLPFLAGTIRRVVVAPDGSAAYGITERRILRLDLELAGHSPAAAGAASVVLDQVEEADVWYPPAAATLGPASPAASGGPPARLAFVLAGKLWVSDDSGASRPLHTLHPWSGSFLRPRWSPDGERLLTVETLRSGSEARSAILLFDRAGGLSRLDQGLGQRWVSSVAWSPAGDRLAVAAGGDAGWWEAEIRVLDLEGAERAPRIPGREVAWTDRGLVVLGNGRPHEQLQGVRVGHAIDQVLDGARRTITDADRLALDPRAGVPAEAAAGLSQLAASADGAYVSAQLYRVGARVGAGFTRGQQTVVIVRTDDGAALSFLSFEPGRSGIVDVEWSPRGALVGHTRSASSGGDPGPPWTTTAVVRDPFGRTLAEHDGRFAGWSPEGDWFYVSRPAGLYAYRLDGSAPVRVGPLGVSVVTTRR